MPGLALVAGDAQWDVSGWSLAARGTVRADCGGNLALHGKDAGKANPSRMLTGSHLALHGETNEKVMALEIR